MKVAIIGAGAAGCFCAANLKRHCPDIEIDIYESGHKPLQKVAITGGGRCNLTNSFAEVKSLEQVYPRGHKLMKRLMHSFDHKATMRWFEGEGVKLVTQEDQCVFPQSQDAKEIVSTLLRCLQGVRICCNHRITQLPKGYDATVITTGGAAKADGLSFLSELEKLELIPPVPSLFTFNIGPKNGQSITELMGVVTEHVVTSLTGTKFRAEGPLLITHWGMSGPAILKLSSHAARWLADHDYRGTLSVNWLGGMNEDEARAMMEARLKANPLKQIGSVHPQALTQRLWLHLLNNMSIAPERRCAEIGNKQLNRMVATLTNDTYPITGQSRFKEEFVTCGGVALSNVNPNTLECRHYPGIYFAGEVLDVDAVTGGFNLQAAWTMGFVVSMAIIDKNDK